MSKSNMIEAVFVWFGGVVTATVSDLAIQVLKDENSGRMSFESRHSLRQLADNLSLGRDNAAGFCRRAIEATGREIAGDDLAKRIGAGMSLHPGVIEALKALPDCVSLWLICDYPLEWLTPFADQTDLYSFFRKDHVIFTVEGRLGRMVPDIFYYVLRQSAHHLEKCILIDSVSPRAVAAVKHGFSSAIFVDSQRLAREFKLRQMLA